jgi:hypothetical protein
MPPVALSRGDALIVPCTGNVSCRGDASLAQSLNGCRDGFIAHQPLTPPMGTARPFPQKPAACPYRKSDPNVLMMQSAEMWLCEDPADTLNLGAESARPCSVTDASGPRCNMSLRLQRVLKVPLAKDNDMIEQFPPDRADQPFNIWVLPRRSRCSRSVPNTHRAKPPEVCLAIGAIAIANNIIRCSLPAASLRQLSSDPFRRRVCRHPQPHDSTSTVPPD